MEVDSSAEENRRQSSVSFKDNENKEHAEPTSVSPKVPKKFINNWKQACDRTKDKTKELLKKWRTLPESSNPDGGSVCSQSSEGSSTTNVKIIEMEGTWLVECPVEDKPKIQKEMTEIQKKKFIHFFVSYLDLDRDDFISLTDFDAFAERLRHFAEWPKNSAEYRKLREVKRSFIETFLLPHDLEGTIHSYEALEKKIKKEQLSVEQWLEKWTCILNECRNFYELPLWLQQFPEILFRVINKHGTGAIQKDEFAAFLSSLLSLTSTQVKPFVDEAYKVLTSNNEHPLTYHVYRLSFANFIFGRYPNGPGQYLFGQMTGMEICCFPIDYKMLNCLPQELEQYSPRVKSNRTSIIV